MIFGDKDHAQCSHDRQLAEIKEISHAEFDHLNNVIHIPLLAVIAALRQRIQAQFLLLLLSSPCTATLMSKTFLHCLHLM